MRKHIAILCSRLDMPGGIERAVINTANLLTAHHYQVSLLILDETAAAFYPIHSSVAIKHLSLDFGITEKGNVITRKIRFYHHIQQLKKVLQTLQPDVIIGTEYHLTIAGYLAARRFQQHFYAWEHHHFHWLKRSRFWQQLYHRVYPQLKTVICLNPAEEALHRKAGHRTVVIPNFIERKEKADVHAKTILTVGHLIHRKGVDLIPAIAEKIFTIYPEWQWVIIGDGPEKEKLKGELDAKGLSSNVSIITPSSPDISHDYQTASIYVMTSRFECFPMVLLEAMAHGVPCISFDCPTGPSFIIQDGINGALVKQENITEMVQALLDLMGNNEKRITQAQNAYTQVEHWSPEVIYKQWESLLG